MLAADSIHCIAQKTFDSVRQAGCAHIDRHALDVIRHEVDVRLNADPRAALEWAYRVLVDAIVEDFRRVRASHEHTAVEQRDVES